MFLKLLPSCKSVHPLQRSYLKYPLEDHNVNKCIILAEIVLFFNYYYIMKIEVT